jgi:hypothetical protein
MRPGLAWAIVGALIVGATVTTTALKPRGIRNRNPGNIEYSSSNPWLGQAGSDGRYAIFEPHADGAFVWGVRAAARLFRNYQARHGLRTIAGMIGRYAPHSENPTQAYIDNVAAGAGVSPYQSIDLSDAELLARVLRGVFRQENGGDFVPLEQIRRGIELA